MSIYTFIKRMHLDGINGFLVTVQCHDIYTLKGYFIPQLIYTMIVFIRNISAHGLQFETGASNEIGRFLDLPTSFICASYYIYTNMQILQGQPL